MDRRQGILVVGSRYTAFFPGVLPGPTIPEGSHLWVGAADLIVEHSTGRVVKHRYAAMFNEEE